MMKKNLLAFIFIVTGFFAFSQSTDFLKGEELFKQNKAAESIEYLQRACNSGANPKAFVYLSLAYFQTGDFVQSIEVCQNGMKVPGTDKKVLAFNAGNVCYAVGNYEEAEKWFSTAVSANAFYTSPLLNRANTRLKLGKIAESKQDYLKYIELVPDDEQRPEIERLLLLLDEEIERLAEEERIRQAEAERLAEEERRIAEQLAAEEKRRKEEERLEAERLAAEKEAQRLEAERIAAEEAARRRKLLEDVASSLQNTETENMSAGAEGTFDYGYETELE